MENTDELITTMTDFLQEIGIVIHFESIGKSTFLPGLELRNGELVVDREKLAYPGDILHEAGQLSVVVVVLAGE